MGEWDRTVAAVAAPVTSADGEIEAVLAAGVPARFMTEERLRAFAAPCLLAATRALSQTAVDDALRGAA